MQDLCTGACGITIEFLVWTLWEFLHHQNQKEQYISPARKLKQINKMFVATGSCPAWTLRTRGRCPFARKHSVCQPADETFSKQNRWSEIVPANKLACTSIFNYEVCKASKLSPCPSHHGAVGNHTWPFVTVDCWRALLPNASLINLFGTALSTKRIWAAECMPFTQRASRSKKITNILYKAHICHIISQIASSSKNLTPQSLFAQKWALLLLWHRDIRFGAY